MTKNIINHLSNSHLNGFSSKVGFRSVSKSHLTGVRLSSIISRSISFKSNTQLINSKFMTNLMPSSAIKTISLSNKKQYLINCFRANSTMNSDTNKEVDNQIISQEIDKKPVDNSNKCLKIDNINQNALNVHYAVRGPIVERAAQLQDELNRNVSKPFNRIIRANIGDCHATGQLPMTFFRQVLAACVLPGLSLKTTLIPGDAAFKAKQILDSCKGSIGCYSESAGIPIIREQVANYIEDRDGHPSFAQDIFITNGASSAVRLMVYLLINNSKDISGTCQKTGILVPIPQYPLYSATISEFDGQLVPYYLDEDTNWSLKIENLEESLANAKRSEENCNPKSIVVINPGNPTGQILTYDNIKEIIMFAHEHKLLIMADEVYQENIHDPNANFYSFKKVMFDMGSPYSDMELVSFHSISKGFYGECGLRGGYMELVNFDPEVKAQISKLMSAQLGSTTAGQVILSCVVDPPKVNDVSYTEYYKQKKGTLNILKKKAEMVYEGLNEIDGITCNKVSGALYAFPRLHLTNSAIEAAREAGVEPDAYYCQNLLECTGVCVVPGSGFKQVPGTYHFRTTILPSVQDMKFMLSSIETFNKMFRERFPE